MNYYILRALTVSLYLADDRLCLIWLTRENRTVIDAEMRDYPPLADFLNPNIDTYNPAYINNLPMIRAYGFHLCQKLAAFDNPDLTFRNCDSFAYFALGKPRLHLCRRTTAWEQNAHPLYVGLYLHRNNWGSFLNEGFATPI